MKAKLFLGIVGPQNVAGPEHKSEGYRIEEIVRSAIMIPCTGLAHYVMQGPTRFEQSKHQVPRVNLTLALRI